MLSVTPAGNEYSNEELLKIGVECANFWYGKGYQCVVALHLDSDFRHFHNATRPLVPSDTDFLPEPVIIKEQGVVTNAQDEFIFSDDDVIIKINCSRQYEVEVPLGYTESQIKHIVEALPRMSEVDKDRHSKRAIAASGKLKDYHMQGQVELDFSEYITFHWSDGTSSTVPRPDITSSEESGDQGERIIDVTYTEE